jgi:hypothetical protein
MFGDDVMCVPCRWTESWRVRPCRLATTTPVRVLATRPRPGLSTEAFQAPARVNVTCVTPLGEGVASTS